MTNLRRNLRKHKYITWVILLGYLAFMGCFSFPFGNELFPFDISKGVILVTGYGIIGMCFAGILDKGKEVIVAVLLVIFTVTGLLCRYILEYGEVSNTMNFTLANIFSFLIIIPLYCTAVYWAIYKYEIA